LHESGRLLPRHLQFCLRADAYGDALADGDTMMLKVKLDMRYFVRALSVSALGALIVLSVAACNNQTGFSGSVGSTPNGPKLTSYDILGVTGTSFTATVSDSRSSWTLQGNVPLNITICNNVLPASIVATKTTSNNNLLSVQIVTGNHIADLQSTTAPFGTVSVQVGGVLSSPAPPAFPDLRINALGPLNEHFQALVEDISTGFIIQGRIPALVLFDQPDGKVDATFFGGQDFGTFVLTMTLNGTLVASVKKGPDATIREP
jgi:hypothetical protein